MKTLADMSRDPEMQELARVRDRGLSDYNSAIGDSYDEGYEAGFEQGIELARELGRKQTLERTALAMIAKGYTDADIIDITELTPERVQQLRGHHA
jgi:hypothetical protein